MRPATRYHLIQADIIGGMGVLADSMIAVFDSNTNLIWTTEGLNSASAFFKLGSAHTKTTFDKISDDEWQVGFESDRNHTPASAIRVFSGVFQAVREFLEVRQPMTLVTRYDEGCEERDHGLVRLWRGRAGGGQIERRAVLKGTRVQVDLVLDNYEAGLPPMR
jgi:hypothetical protein